MSATPIRVWNGSSLVTPGVGDLSFWDGSSKVSTKPAFVWTGSAKLLIWPQSISAVTMVSVTPNASNPTTALDVVWSALGASEIFSHYYIQRAADSGGAPVSYADVHNVAAGTTSWTDTGRDPGTTYWYRVYGYLNTSPDLAGTVGSGLSGATNAAGPTAPDGLVVAQVVGYLSSRLDLSWNDNSADESGFYVRRSVDGGAYSLVHTASANATSWTDGTSTPLEGGRTYAYRVSAYNGSGESGYTSDSEVTELETPTGLSVVNDGTYPWSTQDISWTLNSGGRESNVLLYRKVGAGSWALYQTLAAGTESYEASGLDPETLYTWRVSVTNATAGESAYSNEDSETTAAPVPAQVTGLTATPDATNGDTELDVDWDDVADADGYKLYRGTSPGFTPGTPIYTGAASFFNDTGRSPSTPYYYKCLAYSSGGDGPLSAEASGTTWPTIPQSFGLFWDGFYVDISWDVENRTSTQLTLEVWDNVSSSWDVISSSIAGGTESWPSHSPGPEHIDGSSEVFYRIKFNGEASYASDSIIIPE